MSEQQNGGGFAKAFVPGLVLGLVIGAFVGATLPPMLSSKKLPAPTHNGAAMPREREELPQPPVEETPVDEGSQPGAGEGEQTPPGGAGDGAGEGAGGGGGEGGGQDGGPGEGGGGGGG